MASPLTRVAQLLGIGKPNETVQQLQSEVESLKTKVRLMKAGASGVDITFGGFQYEANQKLRDKRRWDVYDAMEADPHVKSGLDSIALPLVTAKWEVIPATDKPIDKEIAEFVSANLLRTTGDKYGRDCWVQTSWHGQRLGEILDFLKCGFAMFQKSTREVDGKIVYDRLQWLEPRSVDPNGWVLNDTDDIEKVLRTYRTPNLQYFMREPLNANQLSLYVWDLKGARLEGRPRVRSAYGAFTRKDFMERSAVIWAQKVGAPMPVAHYPSGFAPADIAAVEQMVKAARGQSPAEAYAVFPKGPDGEMVEVKFIGAEDGNVDRMGPLISAENAEIAHAVGTMSRLLGETANGSRALGDTQSGQEQVMAQAIALWVCEQVNHGVGNLKGEIQELVDWNFAKVKDYPKLTVSRVGPWEDLSTLDPLIKAVAAGIVPKTVSVMKQVSEKFGLNLKDSDFEELLKQEQEKAKQEQQMALEKHSASIDALKQGGDPTDPRGGGGNVPEGAAKNPKNDGEGKKAALSNPEGWNQYKHNPDAVEAMSGSTSATHHATSARLGEGLTEGGHFSAAEAQGHLIEGEGHVRSGNFKAALDSFVSASKMIDAAHVYSRKDSPASDSLKIARRHVERSIVAMNRASGHSADIGSSRYHAKSIERHQDRYAKGDYAQMTWIDLALDEAGMLEFSEELHPRASDGKFTDGSGESASERPMTDHGKPLEGDRLESYKAVSAFADKVEQDPEYQDALKTAMTYAGTGDARQLPGVLVPGTEIYDDQGRLVSGTYTPEAEAENQRIAESFLSPTAKAGPGEAPTATFLLGKPASGKTTLQKQIIDLSNSVLLNSDAIKERFDGYTHRLAPPFHERSSDVLKRNLEPMARLGRYNVVVDQTGGNADKMLAMAKRMADDGYKITVIHVGVSDLTSVERAYNRFKENGTGRLVPIRTVGKYDGGPTESYAKIKTIAEEWHNYDNEKGYVKIEAGRRDGTQLERSPGDRQRSLRVGSGEWLVGRGVRGLSEAQSGLRGPSSKVARSEKLKRLLDPAPGMAKVGRRAPTVIESETLSLAAIRKDLTTGQANVHQQLRVIRDDMIGELQKHLRAGKITRRNLDGMRRVRYKGASKASLALAETLKGIGQTGAAQLAAEIARGKRRS